MKSAATDLAVMLESSGVGFIGKDIFVGGDSYDFSTNDINYTENINKIVVVLEDTSPYARNSLVGKYQYPTVQVVVKGEIGLYQASWKRANIILDTLHGVSERYVNNSRYLIIDGTGPMSIGVDEASRRLFALNFNIIRAPYERGTQEMEDSYGMHRTY